MRVTLLLGMVGAVALTGCALHAKVEPFGKDTYLVNAIATEGNVRIANKFCGERHQSMQPEHMNGNVFVFRCVDPNTATTPTWRSDGGVATLQVKP